MILLNPHQKALYISIFFTLIGAFICTTINDCYTALPLIIFYIVLLINSYFSVALFSQIIPQNNRMQNFIDCILVLLYIAVAFNIQAPLLFVLFLLFMFITATIKYVLLLGVIDHFALLKKKILVNISGIAACSVALVGILAGYTQYSTWALSISFIIVNILLFFVWPLYRLEK